jgi:hypothetical protein
MMVQQHRLRQVEQEDHTPDANDGPKCDPNAGPTGPVREGGGATGQGNLSPGQASRTGGATGGVRTEGQMSPSRAGQVPPDPRG